MSTSSEPLGGAVQTGENAGSPRLKDIRKEKVATAGHGVKVKKDVLITVIPGHCKGNQCNICVTYCPEKVLSMGFSCVEVTKVDACTKCMLCEIRCPDFAIFVD